MRKRADLPKDLTPQQITEIRSWLNTIDGNSLYDIMSRHTALKLECESKGIPIDNVNHYWYKGESFSIHVKPEKRDLEALKNGIISSMQAYAPKYPEISRVTPKDGHLLVLEPPRS